MALKEHFPELRRTPLVHDHGPRPPFPPQLTRFGCCALFLIHEKDEQSFEFVVLYFVHAPEGNAFFLYCTFSPSLPPEQPGSSAAVGAGLGGCWKGPVLAPPHTCL